MAQTIVQPVETLKVRLQAESAGTAPPRYGSMLNALRLVTSEEGSLALWKGMVPSALRELSYSTLRFGLYKPIKTALGAGTPRDTPVWKMMAAGGAAGGIASFIANPTDLLKTRMQADARYAASSALQTARAIVASEGVRGLYRGLLPPLLGSSLFRSVQFSVYAGVMSAARARAVTWLTCAPREPTASRRTRCRGPVAPRGPSMLPTC
jgi:hypothetical protein